MKSSIFNLTYSIIILIAFLPACKEVGPNIVLRPNHNAVFDTTYIESPVAIPELKNVVIEDFTGVKCTNCPQGHQIIELLKAANPNRIIALAMHPRNSLGLPVALPPSYAVNPDLRNDKVQDLFANYFGQTSQPIAAIDRKLFPGETNILIDKGTWTNHANQEIALATPLNIELTTSFDSTSRELTIATELHYTQNVSEENKMTILLVENAITASQVDGIVVDTFYQHKDVVRDFITDTRGDAIAMPHDAGRVIIKIYKTTLAAAWKPENMKVAAYVHEYVNSKIVYQGKEVDVE